MKTQKYIMSSIPKLSIFLFFLFLTLDNISLFADEFFGQKLSTEDVKWEKINSDKLRSKDKIIKWENLSKEYEKKIHQKKRLIDFASRELKIA